MFVIALSILVLELGLMHLSLEVVQAVLGKHQEIDSSSVCCVSGLELLVLSLAIRGGRRDLLVKRPDCSPSRPAMVGP